MGLFTDFYVGLNIGRYQVDGVKLKKSGKKMKVVSKVSIPYKKKPFDGESLKDENEIVIALGNAGSALKINMEDVISTALFPDKILFRQIEIPNMPVQQVPNAAKFQIVKELSISPEEITVDVDVNRSMNSSNLLISAFVVRNEDISKFNTLFFKSALPFPDILDAGYFKFNYLLEDHLSKGLTFVVFEDISSTYMELFKDGKLVGIDSVLGGTEGITDDTDNDGIKSHYMELSDSLQKLSRMMLSRFSMSNEKIDSVICTSEFEKYIDVWCEILKELQIAKKTFSYPEIVNLELDVPLNAYSLAMRGVLDNSKTKFLSKKN